MGDFFVKNKRHIVFAALLAGTFLILKYIFPLIIPFLLAILIVALIYKPIEKIHVKMHIGRGFLAGVFLLVLFSLIGSAAWFLCTWGIHKICEIIKHMDEYQAKFGVFVRTCSEAIEQKIGIKADAIETVILERVDVFVEDMQVHIMPDFMNQSLFYIQVFIGAVTFLVVMIIAAILIMKDFDKMRQKVCGLKYYDEAMMVFAKIGRLILSFFRAQLLILVVVAVVCIAGLYFAGNKAFLPLGLLTGILDVLPFVGTGIILLPYMLWQFLKGETVSAIILLVTFLISALARELLEPKLIGDKMNVLPILILVSVYAGVQVFGILGILLGPLYMLIISEFTKRIYTVRVEPEDGGD